MATQYGTPDRMKKVLQLTAADDEDVVCSICRKGFASEIALQNHVRMEHFDAYCTGDSSNWTMIKVKQEPITKEEIEQKTEMLLSSMRPTNLMNLVSEDVSYIIVKSEDAVVGGKKKKKESLQGSEEAGKSSQKKEKAVNPITGPFECLQPSTLVADGTCHQIFFSCCEYSLHFRDEHTRKRKAIQCQVCEKPLADGSGLGDVNPFTCEVCDTVYQTKKELKDHINKEHVKFKPFQCSTCLKRFTQQGGLQQHMRMHAGIRPFPCTICPKAFTQKSGLDQHLRIHTKVKPYHCVVCQKSFIQSIHLTQHMRTHTNVAPFQCGECQKKFKQKSHLVYHLRSTHGITDTNNRVTQSSDKKKFVYFITSSSKGLQRINQSEADFIEEVQAARSISIPDNSIDTDGVVLEPTESIQVEQVSDDCYIIDNNDPQTWDVELVES